MSGQEALDHLAAYDAKVKRSKRRSLIFWFAVWAACVVLAVWDQWFR